MLEGKAIGLIYNAISIYGKLFVKELRFKGERQEIKEKAALSALEFLIDVSKG
ncbi:MAG: CinA family protein [Nitrospirae bacterium]|nr:CinA family protein [Nitrospirota bacterium]